MCLFANLKYHATLPAALLFSASEAPLDYPTLHYDFVVLSEYHTYATIITLY